MLIIINDDPRVPMYQSIKENVKEGDMIEKPIHELNNEDKRLVAIDVKARVYPMISITFFKTTDLPKNDANVDCRV